MVWDLYLGIVEPQRYFVMRYSILSLLALAALASCSTVDRRSLADYDDGIYTWEPYPDQGGYSYGGGSYSNSPNGYSYYGDDGYNDGYDDGYNDAFYMFNGPYASPYFSYRPRYRSWNYRPYTFYPSYYYGFNSPYMIPYGMNPYGYNPYMMPYGYPYRGYGGYSPWDPWGMSYGYGYPYGGYGYPYGGFSPWGGMTGSTPSSGGTTIQPVSGNISMRRMNIAGGSATRRPSVENVAGRSSERPGALEETKGQRNFTEAPQGNPMRSIETHASNPSRDEVGRTNHGTIHYVNLPQTETRRPETHRDRHTDVETRRPEAETRRTPSPAVRQPDVQRSAPRNDPPQRTYSEPSQPTPSRTRSEPSRPVSTPSYSAPARPSSPAPSRSTGGRGGR